MVEMFGYLHAHGMKWRVYMEKKYTRISFSGNPSCHALLSWLYDGASIFMNRKYDIYLQLPKPYYQSKYRYTGICPYYQKFLAYISYDGVRHYIGSYSTVKDAIDAYNAEAMMHCKQTQDYKGEELYYE